MLVLNIQAKNLTVTMADKSVEILLTPQQIVDTLQQVPPSEMAWEQAIMLVEDAISPLKAQMPNDESLAISGADELAVLAFEQDEQGQYIRAEILEKAFAVLAGYRSSRDLPDMPNALVFYAKVLLLREWVNHLAVDKVYLAK